jgi:hypothetical protein
MNTFEDQIIIHNTVETMTVVSQGAPGPKGDTGLSESLITFSKRVDFINDNMVFRGEAAVSATDSSPVWRIKKITISNEDVVETWANGTSLFDKVWDNRLQYSYL